MSDKQEKKKKLGVLEFCSALNSDDLRLIKKALAKFTVQVRMERKFALNDHVPEEEGVEEVEDGDDKDEEVELKVEEEMDGGSANLPKWTRDVKQYNVPFVATSLSFGGDEGFVRRGHWPTGLLQAYLMASPRATELLISLKQLRQQASISSSSSNSSKRYDASFLRSYWFAIAELITAASVVGRTSERSPNAHPAVFIQTIVDECIPEMCQQIEASYAYQKKKRKRESNLSNVQKEDGVTPAILYCFIQILMIVQTNSSNSIAPAVVRNVYKKISSSLNSRIVSAMLRMTPDTKKEEQMPSLIPCQRHPKDYYFSFIQPQTLDTSTACILLASAMLLFTVQYRSNEQQQYFLLSSMISCKVASSSSSSSAGPGIAYLSLAFGLNHIESCSPLGGNYYLAVSQFMIAIRQCCLLEGNMTNVRHYLLALINKSKCDFFSAHGLTRLSKLAATCTVPVHSVEDDTIIQTSASPKDIASMEARSLLLILIGDQNRSPLYFNLSTKTAIPYLRNDDDTISHHSQQQQLSLISKTLFQLTSTTTAESFMHEFIRSCFQKSPGLVPLYFKSMVPFTSNESNESIFSSEYYLCNVTRLVSGSPSIAKCWHASWNELKLSTCYKNDDLTTITKIPDSLMMCIYPVHCFNKAIIQKLLSFPSSSIVVLETLNLLEAVIQRCETFLSDDGTSSLIDDKKILVEALEKRLLPDIPWMLSLLRSKLEVHFSSSSSLKDDSFLPLAHLCKTLCRHYKILSATSQSSKNENSVDIIAKLLAMVLAVKPSEQQSIGDSETSPNLTLLQLHVLHLIEAAAQCQSKNDTKYATKGDKRERLAIKCTSKTFKMFLDIFTFTKSNEIRNVCQKLIGGSIMHLANSSAPNDGSVHEDAQMGQEQRNCLLNEAYLWTDILLSSTNDVIKKEAIISCMEKLFDTVLRRFMEHFIYAAQAFIGSAENEDELRKNHKFTSTAVLPSSFCFSPFLNFALHGLSEFPEEFVRCVILVTVKCLLFYEDPVPLALLVSFHASKGKPGNYNMSSSALETLDKYSRQIILLGGIDQTDTESQSSQLSLSSTLTDVLENIFQSNNDNINNFHQALLCKLFTSSHPKVQQEVVLATQSMISQDSTGAVSISVTRQILHLLKLVTCSATITERHFDFLHKCSYYQHIFTLLQNAILTTSEMKDQLSFYSVVTLVFSNLFFSEIQSSSHLMLVGVTLRCLYQISSAMNNSSFFEGSHGSLSILQCLEKHTAKLHNWILAEQNHSTACNSTLWTHVHFLGGLGTVLPNSSRISLASALMFLVNDHMTTHDYDQTPNCNIYETRLTLALEELHTLLKDYLTSKAKNGRDRSADKLLFMFYKQALLLWKNLINVGSEDVFNQSSILVLTQLEDIIVDTLTDSDQNIAGSSSLLNIAMNIITPTEIMSLSYKSLQQSMLACLVDGSGEKKGKCMVFTALISFSCSYELILSSFQFLSEKQNKENFEDSVLWKSGFLDTLIIIIFSEPLKGRLQEAIHAFPTVFLLFARRMVYIFGDVAEDQWQLKLQCTKACEVFLDLSTHLNDNESLVTLGQIPLRSSLFDFLVQFFPKILKKKSLMESKSTLGAKSLLFDAIYVAKAFQRILNSSEASQCIVQCSAELIAVLVKACLKKGINPDEDWSPLASECLKTVHLLLKVVRKNSTAALFLEHGRPLDVARIYNMISMHSQYKALMSQTPRTDDTPSVKVEVIKLQILCVLSAKDSITLDNSGWEILVQSHYAGVCHEDNFLRQLLYLFMKKDSECIYFMDEMLKVGPFASCSIDDRWGHIFTLLDHYRLRCTLSDFPDWEQSLSRLESEGDVEIILPYKAPEGEGEEDSVGNESNPSNDGSKTEVEGLSESHTLSPLGNRIARPWLGLGPDLRYSPAFLLPIMLGFLEYYLPVKDDNPSQSSGINVVETETTAEGQTFAKMTHRLCDNGGLALALASLSCKCPRLRQTAVAVLLLIMRALTSQEAKMIREWRHRPQILMLLESVQRGLCLRRRQQETIQRQTENDVSRRIVPMFSTVSAIFLARSSIILCNPGDPMYRAINSYFLRIVPNQGAFVDSGGRIPAFVSLYCSTDDSWGHAKRERCWMLYLIQDAVKDRNSFKAAIRCHATSLLLGAIDTIGSSSTSYNDDTENVAIIQAIESMLRNGEELSASHFLCHMGLLSWLHGFLVSRDCSKVLPSLKSRVAFLSLTSTAVHVMKQMKGCKWNSSRETIIELTALASSVLELVSVTLNQLSDASIRRDSKAEQRFYALIPIFYWDVYVTLDDEPSFQSTDRCWINTGISLHSAMAVLSKLKPHFEEFGDNIVNFSDYDQPTGLAKLTWSLSFLPIQLDPIPQIKELCLMMTSIALQNSSKFRCSALTCVLRRIADFSSIRGTPSVVGDADILLAVIICRKFCIGNHDAMNAWKKCTASLLSNSDTTENSVCEAGSTLLDAAKLLISS